MIEALVLDYGGVLSLPQPDNWYQLVALRLGVAADLFHTAYWQHRQAYDAGLPAEEYWTRVLATLGRIAQASEVERLIESDVVSWTRYREDVWDVARSFRRLGGRTGFLSNGVPEAMVRIRAERQLESCFDAVIVSCEVGVAKPDARIYQMCLSRLGVAADQTLFVDDRLENLQGAAKLGMRTLHFASGDAIKQLTELINVPPRSTR
jgi:putative hydrolase of the HAD superfamily